MARIQLWSRALATIAAFSSVVLGARAAGAAGTVLTVTAPIRKMTLSEFAHSRLTSHLAAGARPVSAAGARPAPAAWLSTEAAAAVTRSAPNTYLLYASAMPSSGLGFVNIYLAGPAATAHRLVGRISGLDAPGGLAVDAHGTLYVAQVDVGAPVLVFPLGASAPSLRLDTQGTVPVAVAVGREGTVFVSTATADILVYLRGASEPSKRYSALAGDGVQAVQTDQSGNIYFAGNFISYGTVVGEITPRGEATLGHFSDITNGLFFDSAGNGLTIRASNRLDVYAHHTAHLLHALPVAANSQSFTLNGDDSAAYVAGGTIYEYGYPSGALVAKIAGLENCSTFGLATFPASPLAPPW